MDFKNYWEDRYVNNSTGWDLGHASAPLKSIIDKIENKNIEILIPGAGNGYEAIYLIEKGFLNVTVLDIAIQPITQLRKQLKNKNSIKIIQEDFFSHIGNYDLILEQTFLCSLESRFRESYIKKNHELLKKNGHIEGVLFDFKSQTNGRPFTASKKEYLELFENQFNVIKMDRCENSEDSRKGKELLIKIQKK